MKQGEVRELAITLRQTYRLAQLPMHHRDPFDRLLVATALEEDLTLLTDDKEIHKYEAKVAW